VHHCASLIIEIIIVLEEISIWSHFSQGSHLKRVWITLFDSLVSRQPSQLWDNDVSVLWPHCLVDKNMRPIIDDHRHIKIVRRYPKFTKSLMEFGSRWHKSVLQKMVFLQRELSYVAGSKKFTVMLGMRASLKIVIMVLACWHFKLVNSMNMTPYSTMTLTISRFIATQYKMEMPRVQKKIPVWNNWIYYKDQYAKELLIRS
jgi:hypothetical protein